MNKSGRRQTPYWIKTPTRIKLKKMAQAKRTFVGVLLDEIIANEYDKFIEQTEKM